MNKGNKYHSEYDDSGVIEQCFTYHNPADNKEGLELTLEKYKRLRLKAYDLASDIMALVPPSKDRDDAITLLRQSVALANAGIATEGVR